MELKSPNLDRRTFSSSKIFAATPITEFYSGKSVFITGSTGFVGTLLLGKLLTTCPIKRAYVLIKPKKGKSVSERLKVLLKSVVFDEVRENDASLLDNIVPIPGDITHSNLGISDEHVDLLSREIQVVFHSAASIDMCATLADAINVNTKSIAELVKFCKNMQQLQAFVYVSTAFSNCNRNLIDERVYEPSTSLDAVYDVSEKLDTVENAHFKRNLIEGRPNTYTYSKSLAEKIIDDEILGIPAAIVRPSISSFTATVDAVCKTVFQLGGTDQPLSRLKLECRLIEVVSPIKTPLPGWAVSWNSVNKISAGITEGFLRCIYGSDDSTFDIVPGDQVANLLIATAWDVHRRRLKKVKVYNCCTSYQNPMTLGNFVWSCSRVSRKYSEKMICTNMIILTTNHWLHILMNIIFHIIPSYVLDIMTWLGGQQGRMRKFCTSFVRECGICEYFCDHSITFINYNVTQLFREMHPEDKILFDFDFSAIDWESFFHSYILGLKKYVIRK